MTPEPSLAGQAAVGATNRPPTFAQRVTGIALITLAFAFLAWVFGGMSPSEWLGVGITAILAIALGLIGARYKRVGRTFERLLAAYMKFAVWMLAALLPLPVFRYVFQVVISQLPLWAQVPIFVMLGVLLAWAVLAIATEDRRDALFASLRRTGAFAPLVYTSNVLMVSAMFFASLTFMLARHGFVTVAVAGSDQVVSGRLLDFYVWNFLEVVPLVEVNKTLHWEEPIKVGAGALAFLVLLFKVAVTVPAVGAFAGYFESKGKR